MTRYENLKDGAVLAVRSSRTGIRSHFKYTFAYR